MKSVHHQLKQLNLTHIFYGNIVAALVIGVGMMYLLLHLALPHFIPVVLFMMYYMPLMRMDMRRYLYSFRAKVESLPDEQLLHSITFIHTEWKTAFYKTVWVLRINVLVFFLFAGVLWLIRFYLLDSIPYSSVVFHITATTHAFLLAWMNIRQYQWLKEEIPQCNEELF